MGLVHRIPWAWVKQLHRDIRKRFFTIPRPEGEYIRVEKADLQRSPLEVFGEISAAPNWEFSYNKHGEDLNLARVIYYDDFEHEDLIWWQFHVRGWEYDDHWLFRGHWESEPTEHEEAHTSGRYQDVAKGNDWVTQTFSEIGIPTERVAWSR